MKTKTENKQDAAQNGSAVRDCPDSAGSEWLGTCEHCGTQRPIGGGISSMGRKWLYVLLTCEKCRFKLPHKFLLKNARDDRQLPGSSTPESTQDLNG